MSIVYSKSLRKGERVLFELLPGYSCNASCQFCSISPCKRKINSTTAELLQVIYQAKKEGFIYLGIGGGEPTIRKDLVKLIGFAKKLKFEIIRIETNGISLAYSDYCRSLIDAGLDFVKISIHGHKPQIHDFLTRVPGSFDKVLQAIENLQRLKIRVEINTVVNSINYKFYPQFVNFFTKKGVGSFCFIYPLYTGRMVQDWQKIGISIKESVPYLKKALELTDAFELDKVLIFNIPPCCLPGHEMKMVELSPFNTKVGAPDVSIESVDYHRIKAKVKLEKCRSCVYFKNCEGIWKDYIKFFGSSEFIPILKKIDGEN